MIMKNQNPNPQSVVAAAAVVALVKVEGAVNNTF